MQSDDLIDGFWRTDLPELSLDRALIGITVPATQRAYPAIASPGIDGVELARWLTSEREVVEGWQLQYGAVLFRGFPHAPTAATFREISAAAISQPMAYTDRSSPRTVVDQSVYTSTNYPSGYDIAMHSELSYSHTFPRHLAFFCVRPAIEGGATPLVDTRVVLSALSSATRSRFEKQGVRYTRRLSPSLGMSWQEVYGTEDRAEVEARCNALGVELTWRDDGGVVTQWTRPAICRHPITAEAVWFNHALFFNVANLDPEVALSLGSDTASPFETSFGDGSPIDEQTVDEIAQAYRQAESTFSWQPGDLLLLDNMLMAHGRRAYHGERLILVAMGTM